MKEENLDSIIEQLESGIITDEELEQEREELSKMSPDYYYSDDLFEGEDNDQERD